MVKKNQDYNLFVIRSNQEKRGIMDKKELLYSMLESNLNIPTLQVVMGLVICMLLSLFVYWVYRKTYSGVMYSKNFNITIILVAIITCMIMMIIGSNLALSLGMVGALSIIRFRTAVKEPKDICFLFWGIGVGLASGTGMYTIGIITSIFIAILLFVLDKGMYDSLTYLLIIRAKSLEGTDVEKILKNHVPKYKLKMKNVSSDSVDITYEIRLERLEEQHLIQCLKEAIRVESINLVSYNGEIAG